MIDVVFICRGGASLDVPIGATTCNAVILKQSPKSFACLSTT